MIVKEENKFRIIALAPGSFRPYIHPPSFNISLFEGTRDGTRDGTRGYLSYRQPLLCCGTNDGGYHLHNLIGK